MKQGLCISIAVAAQLLSQFVTQLLVIRVIGVGPITDAYIAAQAVPMVLVAVLTAALQSAWLPRLSVLSENFAASKLEQMTAQGQSALLGIGSVLVGAVTMRYWLPLLYPGFDEQQLLITLGFSLVFMAAAAFNVQSAVLTVGLRAVGRYTVAEIVAMLAALLSLVSVYYMLPKWGIAAAVWIALGRSILIYLVLMNLTKWPYPSVARGWNCTETWVSMRPLLFGASLYKTSPLVDRYWASKASPGAITTLNLAQTAIGGLAAILERSICTPIAPTFARHVARDDYRSLRRDYRKGIFKVSVVVAGVGLILVAGKSWLIHLASVFLNISTDTASVLWLVCLLLLGYLHVAASGTLAVAAFYAMGDPRTPVKIGLAGFVLSLGLKAAGFLLMGLPGLVLATSIYYTGNMLAMCFSLEKSIDEKVS